MPIHKIVYFLMCACVVNTNVVACTVGLEMQRVIKAFGSGCVLAYMQGVHVWEYLL